MSDCTTSNAFLEWMQSFMDNEQSPLSDEDQLDMFNGEHLIAESEPVIKPV